MPVPLYPAIQSSGTLKQEQSHIPRVADSDDYNCQDSPDNSRNVARAMLYRRQSRLTVSCTAVDEQHNTGLDEAVISKQKRDRDGSDEVTAGAN